MSPLGGPLADAARRRAEEGAGPVRVSPQPGGVCNRLALSGGFGILCLFRSKMREPGKDATGSALALAPRHLGPLAEGTVSLAAKHAAVGCGVNGRRPLVD